jgi:hypothetical protein
MSKGLTEEMTSIDPYQAGPNRETVELPAEGHQ